ncbi:MAG: hypothetical protein HYV48_05180, partial [Candidatus Omnitrophica bacterium]|nr:hypothetical protein [Candidatus Omnitrophota bacterium]
LDIDIKGAVGKTVKEEEGKTIVKANISNPEDIEVSWRPKPPSIEKMEAVIFAETVGVLRISGGVISQSSHIKLTPVQGMIEKIEFGLPEGFSLLGVKGENIKEWKEKYTEDKKKHIIVELHRKSDKGYELLVETQKQLGVLPDEIDLDGIELTGVKQERGYLGVVVGEELQLADIRAEGLSQIESERMPNISVGQGERLLVSYRYITSGYKITGRVNQLKAEVEVESRQTIAVGENSIEHSYRGRYKIEKAGIFGLSVWIPEGYTVTDVKGKEIADWKEKEEEKIDEETGYRQYVDITLNTKVTGEYEIEVRLEKSLKELEKVVGLHGAASRGVKKEAGYIAVASDAGVRLKTGRMENLREVAVGEITGGERGVISLAYRYLKVPWALDIETEEVIPVVTAEVFHLVTVGEGYMAGSVTSIYQIELAPTKEFEFRVPVELKNVEITGENIRRKEVVGQENNKDIWSVTLQDKVMGGYSLVLTYDFQEPGGSYRLNVPEIEVGKVERESGYIGLGRRANIEIKEVESSLAGVDSIDTKEIPTEYMRLVKVPVVSGYKYWRHPYKVEAEIGKYEDVGILQAIVDRAQITTVVAEDGQLISQASYMVKNNSQQYMKVILPEGSELWSSFVSGRAVKPSKSNNSILIPIERSQETFPVEIVYVRKMSKLGFTGTFKFESPQIDMPLKDTAWSFYLPMSHRYHGFGGTMQREIEREVIYKEFSADEYQKMRDAEVLQQKVNVDRYASVANELLDKRKYDEAIHNLSRALEYEPGNKYIQSQLEVAKDRKMVERESSMKLKQQRAYYGGQKGKVLEEVDKIMQKENARLRGEPEDLVRQTGPGPVSQSQPSQKIAEEEVLTETQELQLQKIQTAVIEKKALPLKITIPIRGERYSFKKALATKIQEKMVVEIKYIKKIF